VRVVAVLVSALAYALAFPPTALRPLAWVALVPLLVALRQAPSLARALGLAWLWTVAAA
jgi:apolipoprotein N-acyltransferase